MARRKSYRGTPEAHTKDAALLLRIMKRAASNARRAADQGRCKDALDFYGDANSEYGAYSYAKGYATHAKTRRAQGVAAPLKLLRRTQTHVAQKCFLKRF